MQVGTEVHKFSCACEHLMGAVLMSRCLTEDEARIVEYYCKEVLEKLVPPSISSLAVNKGT